MSSSERISLKAERGCAICRGVGEFNESHGPGLLERMVCDCVFRNAPQDASSQARIDAGEFTIVSDLPPEPQSAIWEYGDE